MGALPLPRRHPRPRTTTTGSSTSTCGGAPTARRSSCGGPVASYVVPVEDVEIPARRPAGRRRHRGGRAAHVTRARPRRAWSPTTGTRELHSPRVLELLELAENAPTSRPWSRTSPTPTRRCAVPPSPTVTEVVPEGTGPALAARLLDDDDAVRHAAAVALREVVEVLPADEATPGRPAGVAGARPTRSRGRRCSTCCGRCRLGDAATFTGRLRRRRPAGPAAGRPRAGVARRRRRGLAAACATIGPRGTGGGRPRTRHDRHRRRRRAADRLAGDAEPLVRAAALEASAGTVRRARSCGGSRSPGSTPPSGRSASGAARGLARGAAPRCAVPPLVSAVADPHADVRKAAVIALAGRTDRPRRSPRRSSARPRTATPTSAATPAGRCRIGPSRPGQPPLIRVFAWS